MERTVTLWTIDSVAVSGGGSGWGNGREGTVDTTQTSGRLAIALAQAQFDPEVVYLNTASVGLAPRRSLWALQRELGRWRAGTVSPPDYDVPLEAARCAYAGLVGVDRSWVAVGSQVSVFAGLVAASLPAGSEVLTAGGEFTSIVFPFLAQARRTNPPRTTRTRRPRGQSRLPRITS